MKDALGHGSDARGGTSMTNRAHETVANGRRVDARHQTNFPNMATRLAKLQAVSGAAANMAAAADLANGHPKSAPVPVHAGAAGRVNFGGFP